MLGGHVDASIFQGLGPRMQVHELGMMRSEIAAAHGVLLDAVPVALAVLNEFWQVLFTNARFNALLDLREPSSILGLRLGEMSGCANAGTSLSGCGTSLSCPQCSVFKIAYRADHDAGASVSMVLPVVGAVTVDVGMGLGTPVGVPLRVCSFSPA